MVAISFVGVAGMIVGSIKDNNGIAITFGLVTAIAVVFLILLTTVVTAEVPGPPGDARPTAEPEQLARDVERRIQALVASGSDETEVRQLVTQAVQLGRYRR